MPSPKTPMLKNALSKNAYSSKMPSPKTRPRIEKTPDRIPPLDPFHPCLILRKGGDCFYICTVPCKYLLCSDWLGQDGCVLTVDSCFSGLYPYSTIQ